MFGSLDYFSYGLFFSVSNIRYARTKIFFNTQTFTRLFLFKITVLKMYVCRMKIAYTINLLNNQIKTLFIFILNKLFIMVTNNKITPPY